MSLSPEPERPGLHATVARIAGLISSDRFATGDRAALRRMAPEQPPPLVFYRLGVRYLPEGWEHTMDDWVTLVAALAIMAPNAFRPDHGLGQALAEATYSEARGCRGLRGPEVGLRRLDRTDPSLGLFGVSHGVSQS